MNVTIERRCGDKWRKEGRTTLRNFLDAHDIDPLTRFCIETEIALSGRYQGGLWRLQRVSEWPSIVA